MRLVPIGSIKEGSVLAKTVYDDKETILLSSGVQLTSSLIARLIENQVLGVFINDSYSNNEIIDVISPELRVKAVSQIRKTFQSIRQQLNQSIRTLESDKDQLSKKLNLMVDKKYFRDLDFIVADMIDEIIRNREAMIGLVDIKNMRSFVYQHSIQVTVLSLLIGAAMKMNKNMLKDLAIGAMLHDIGFTLINKDLIIYKDSFTEEESNIYRSHCQLGYDFIRQNTSLSTHVRMCILQHHEEYSGYGFPNGLAENNIHINARIIQVADTYDKMSSGINGVMIPPNEVIEFIMGNSGRGRMFDFEIANLFVRKVIPFPIGSYVLLSNGQKAIVINYNSNNPLRPIVKILIEGKKIEDLKSFNLLDYDKLNITIKQIVYD